MDDLVTINDPDWALYQSQDPAYLLGVASDTIRKYCGWHIFPSTEFTLDKVKIGSWGKIMLPSLMLTDVASVFVRLTPDDELIELDPTSYTWFENGYIQPMGFAWWVGQYGGYYGGYYGATVPPYSYGLATATFTSGYAECPGDIKDLAFELAQGSMNLPAGVSSGNVKQIQSPQYSLSLGGDSSGGGGSGSSLNPDQKNRLASYRIGGWTAGIP